MNKEKIRKRNFKIFTLSNSIMALAVGLFGPFYYIFINDFGGSIENFGFAAGLLVLSGALFSFVSGRISDKIGRKPFLIIGGFASSIIVFSYTIINSIWQLYILQILSGIISSGFETAEGSYLGDITSHEKRGEEMGQYDAMLGIFEAVAIFAGGILAGLFGFKLVFYLVAGVSLLATLVMLKLKE